MQTQKIVDVIGIGIGPFNLGLAALAADIEGLDCLFIDKNESFQWHPGLLLPTAKMQVPFYADLVTLADPTSRFTYMNYLKATGKLFRFAINESYFPYRSEFNAYCQWVAAQLPSLHFGWTCDNITWEEYHKCYVVHVREKVTGKTKKLRTRHVVLGIGTAPKIPGCAKDSHHPLVFHASEYLTRKYAALMHKKITIIGSGQSAAEIFLDLLPHLNDMEQLHWITRSSRFHPMDYSKLTLEMSSPDYIKYFYRLSPAKKKMALQEQQYLYKGINFELINTIYEELYRRFLDPNNRMPEMRTSSELIVIDLLDHPDIELLLYHWEKEQEFTVRTNAVILATGYEQATPDFLSELQQHIQWTEDGKYDVQKNYSIDRNNSLFVQNAEQHSHGFNSADLGLGPYRNAVILNSILNKTHFDMMLTRQLFQTW